MPRQPIVIPASSIPIAANSIGLRSRGGGFSGGSGVTVVVVCSKKGESLEVATDRRR